MMPADRDSRMSSWPCFREETGEKTTSRGGARQKVYTTVIGGIKAESGKNITVQCTLWFPTVKILLLSKDSMSNFMKHLQARPTLLTSTDIQLAKVKVGQLTCYYCLPTNVMKKGECNWCEQEGGNTCQALGLPHLHRCPFGQLRGHQPGTTVHGCFATYSGTSPGGEALNRDVSSISCFRGIIGLPDQ